MTKKKLVLKTATIFDAAKQKKAFASKKYNANAEEEMTCQERKIHRKIRWMGIVLTVFLIFAVAECGKQYMRIQDMKQQLLSYQLAYEDAQKQQVALKTQLSLFQNPSYLERIARENLRMVKPGEYLIVPAEESDALDLVEGGDNVADLH